MKTIDVMLLAAFLLCAETFAGDALAQPSKYVSIFVKQDSAGSLSHFKDANLNFEFDYPRALVKMPDSEKDLIVKLGGLANQKHVELKFTRLPDAPDLRIAEQLITSNFQKALAGCSVSGKRNIRFGKGLTFTGSETLFHFRMGDELFATRIVLLSNRDQTYLISFVSTANDDATAKLIFEQVLSSIQQQSASTQPQTQVRSDSWSFEKFNDPSRQVAFDYPQGWKQEHDPGKEFELKFRGANKDGLGGELVVSRLERNPALTLDQFFETYEQTYLKPLKNYQRLSSSHGTFGISRQEGSMTSSTFTAEGHQFRHLTAFFAEGKYYYAVALTGGLWSEREMRSVFDRILASFKVSE
ncbi:MAG: hypothetical protein JST89_08350 [Cyanobacteria bacterium SZAS-4]|nr:hypothetical protein [Cyanobacteria bacterium SZAS-4]